ncbi:hypothetical protein [Streptomyces sp. DW26H14]|uniref:hypothetical protein n=1 Tax=Streptomyces sp. DW26H14 TaxID=3435395 RepID=UPI00403DCEA4
MAGLRALHLVLGKVDCSASAFADRDALYREFNTEAHDRAERCATDRDWPQPVTALVLAVPLSGVGAVLFATGAVSLRMWDHEDARLRAER